MIAGCPGIYNSTLHCVQKQNKFNLQIFTCLTLPSQPESSLPCQQAYQDPKEKFDLVELNMLTGVI